jgi:hypothetical protein
MSVLPPIFTALDGDAHAAAASAFDEPFWYGGAAK